MRQAGDIGALYVLIAVLIYTNIYFLRSPWRSSALTIIFAIKNVLVVFLVGQVVASLFWPDYPGREWLRFFDYWACGTAYLALSVLLWRMQSQDRAQFRADEDAAREEHRTRSEADQ
ncbi:membrane protein [Gordonia phage KappaFarmDelta]|nr:membrane protein [Gordonia phage KappaFarmDelta]